MQKPKNTSHLFFQTQGMLSNQCGKYALNNLVGSHLFTTQYLTQIANNLKEQYNQNFKHFLGGDYDSTLLIKALDTYQYETKWLDNRHKNNLKQILQEHNINRLGFLINRAHKTNSFKKFLGFSQRHWISVKICGDLHFCFDSKQEEPKVIADVQKFIYQQMKNESHVIQVLKAKNNK